MVVNSLGKMKKIYPFVILLICNVFFISAQSINKIAPIIPMPNKIDFGNGSIDFNIETILIKKLPGSKKISPVLYSIISESEYSNSRS